MKVRISGIKHIIAVSFLVVGVTILLITGMQFIRLLPTQASQQAVPIDDLFNLEFKIIAFLFSLIVVFMVYSVVFFRRKRGDLTDAGHVTGNTTLEITWTSIPLATVLFIAYLGGDSLAKTMRVDPQAMDVNVIASQWSWRFEYPDSGIVSNELVLPVDKQAVLHLSSQDVIHSFWVPEFRVKQDALPGGDAFVRDLRITPTIIGHYKVLCTELCGTGHANMVAPVRVLSTTDFTAWVQDQSGETSDPVALGQKYAKQLGCVGCHSVDGSKSIGPTWKGLSGSPVPLTDGSSVTADEAYLRESILNPGAKIVQGYSNIMPGSYASQLSDKQIDALLAYIQSLK